MENSKYSSDIKRLFFGFEIEAAWMHPLPTGRVLKEENRHMTLAFLGNESVSRMQNELNLEKAVKDDKVMQDFELESLLMGADHSQKVKAASIKSDYGLKDCINLSSSTAFSRLKDFPRPNFILGFAGRCDHLLFLPEKAPRVVAGHIEWFDPQAVVHFHQELSLWLQGHGHKVDSRKLLSHVTIARAPFHIKDWKKAFSPFPLVASAVHLYESLGDLNYHPVWSLPFLSPIKEIEHIADIAFHIRAKDIQQLFFHAQTALAFKFPDMLHYFSDGSEIQNLDELIIQLNKNVSRADADVGCPFKAVSFHGEITKDENGLLFWEMIVDV